MKENSKTFEESLARLEEIVKLLDTDKIDLETALTNYEEAVGLLKQCHYMLEAAQRKIELLRTGEVNGMIGVETVMEEDFRTNDSV